MADYTPEERLIGGPLWTRQAVVELVRLVVGVDMTEQGVGLWLRRHGFTPRRPARRAYEQQAAAVRAWLDEDSPVIEARRRPRVLRSRGSTSAGCARTPRRPAGRGRRRAGLRWCG
ncbi:helix-turn-helix domain-containing protein [Saccharothrix stipae]